jgi:hypothetical protein
MAAGLGPAPDDSRHLRLVARGSILNKRSQTMRKSALRAAVEMAFIIFLFYSNLLMGEFEKSGMGSRSGLAWAIRDIFTWNNFVIAFAAALVGHALFDVLRNRLWNRKDSN